MNPRELRGPPWRGTDPLFGPIFLASVLLHTAGAACVALSPKPPFEEPPAEVHPADRLSRVRLPQKISVQPDKHARGAGGSNRASSTQVLPQQVGLLRLLTGGAGAGAFQDVLGEHTGAGDIAEALKGTRRLEVASADVPALRSALERNRAQGIGPVGSSGVASVALGEKEEGALPHAPGPKPPRGPKGDSPSMDELTRFIHDRIKALQWCYERELLHHPDLHGRLELRFTVTPRGRAEDVEFEDDTLGSDAVASCIRSLLRSWVLPVRPDEDRVVAYPLVFTHSQ